MAELHTVLTDAQRGDLELALKRLEQTASLIKAAQACGMECGNWSVTRDTLERNIKSVLQVFKRPA